MSEAKAEQPRTIESCCREVKELLQQCREPVATASWLAGEQGNHELSKALRTLDDLVGAAARLMITLPRLKG